MVPITCKVIKPDQTVLPKQVVKALHLKPDARLRYEMLDDGTVLLTSKPETFASLAGRFAKRRVKRPVTIKEMQAAAAQGAAKAYKRSIA
jgi:hypothetical protein